MRFTLRSFVFLFGFYLHWFCCVSQGQTVHAYHYRCEECGCEFKGGNCREFEGGLYCIEDYEKMMKQICESCQKPILGRVVSALGKVYHPEHFVCATCNSAFQGSNYFEHDGKAYCEYDYTQQFGDPCAKCGRPVARNAVEFAGKVYHAEHFVCHAWYAIFFMLFACCRFCRHGKFYAFVCRFFLGGTVLMRH